MEEKENEVKKKKNNAVTVIEKPEINNENQKDFKMKTLKETKEENELLSNDNNSENSNESSNESSNENYNNNTKRNKNKSKLGLILIITATLIIILALLSTIFAVININNENIIKGVQIAQIDLSDMTKEKAKITLEEIYSKKIENEIYLKYEEFESITTYNALEVEYQIEQAIEQAYQIGRRGNLLQDNFEILEALTKGIQINLEVTIDEEMLNQVVHNINNSISGAIIQPDFYQEDETLIITSGKSGLKVNEKELLQEINNIVKKGKDAETIEIPFITAEPEDIDLEKIHKEVYREVQNAYYITDPFTIYPEVEGIDFDIENAKILLAEQKEKYEIPLIITKPTKTIQEIGTEAFPDLLSTFSTNYQASNVNRTTNLRLAASKINGTVLLPGEEFSYNKTVGERTVVAGFKPAAIYSNGKVVDGLGGGICQISTTLYDAVVMANLDVTERRNHQFVTSYVPAGKDATVVWGAQDFKFKNTRKYPIRITATVEGGTATVQIWGLKEEVEYEITIETKKTATINYTTQYIQDPSLPAGQQKVVQEGNNGRKVEAYKITKLNGQVISTTLLSKDTYNAMQKIVHVGTGQ